MDEYEEEYLLSDVEDNVFKEFRLTSQHISYEAPSKNEEGPSCSGINKKACKKRAENFSSSDKRKLAAAVKTHEEIWDLSNKKHFNINAICRAWKEISASIHKPVSQCKSAWTSLRESHRYRTNQIRKKKSGSAGTTQVEEPVLFDEETVDWEFAKDLAFLPNISKRRRTFETTQSEEDIELENNNESNYSYSRPSTSASQKEDSTIKNLAESIGQLVDLQKTFVPTQPNDPPLVFKAELANIDKLLQKLPPNIAQDVCYDMYTLVYRKLKEYEV